MNIMLSKQIESQTGSNHASRLVYNAGEVILVTEASNLPADSKIKFWVNQDGWQDDPYGLPVYEGEYHEPIRWTKISHDVNGNPRYVCHFMNLLTQDEKQDTRSFDFVSRLYAIACKRANTIGGRKYHTRHYGGGIVFQSYAIRDTERSIYDAIAKAEKH